MTLASQGFAYSFRRTWMRLRTVVIIAVGIGVALAAASQVASNPPAPANLYSAVVFYVSGAYHFEFHAFNEFGDPLPGVVYNISIQNSSGTPILVVVSGVTASNGSLELSMELLEGTYQAIVLAGPQSGGVAPNNFWSQGEGEGDVTLEPWSPGLVVPVLGPIATAVDRQTGFSGEPGLQLFYPTPSELCEPGCPVSFALVNLTNGVVPSPLPRSSLTPLGDISAPLQTFSLVIRPNSSTPFLHLQVEIFSPTGSFLAMDTNCSAQSFSPYLTPTSVSSQAFSYFSSDLILLLPLLAIAAAFSAYAGDRLSGVLDASLAQPITRQGLVSSRFLAATTALWLMIGVGILASDGLIHLLLGYYVLPSYLLAVFLSGSLVAVFFVGMVFLLSHLVRSVLTVLSTGFGLFLLFGVFWFSILYYLEGMLSGGVGTPAGTILQVHLMFLNPLEYGTLALAAITNTTPAGATVLGGNPAGYGITPVTVGLALLAWAVTPLLLLLWRVWRRD